MFEFFISYNEKKSRLGLKLIKLYNYICVYIFIVLYDYAQYY